MFYIYLVKYFNIKMIVKRFYGFCLRRKININIVEFMLEFIFIYIFVDILKF